MPDLTELQAWILSREWHDTTSGIDLEFWCCSEAGTIRIKIAETRAVCFINRMESDTPVTAERKQVQLESLQHHPVDALYFKRQADLAKFADSYSDSLFETDIKPADRYLMERFITGGITIQGILQKQDNYYSCESPSIKHSDWIPQLNILSLDIETNIETDEILSIAGVWMQQGQHDNQVFIVSDAAVEIETDSIYQSCSDERNLLQAFFDWFQEVDPDVLIGWNIINFDLQHIYNRCQKTGLRFSMGRGPRTATLLPPINQGQTTIARLPGRVVLDGIDTLRAAFWSFESFSLNDVADKLLGKSKLIHDESNRADQILALYRSDKPTFIRYNLQDCQLVCEIFQKTDLINFSLERAIITGLAFGRTGGSVAAFDFLYLPRLHRHGFVANDSQSGISGGLASPGGYVMDSVPGFYRNVLVLDFKSLYPSIIRTFLIDPMGLHSQSDKRVPGFDGATFDRKNTILPELIHELWKKRDQAKAETNAPLSQAVKIIMNSFYGVLGSSACRFYNPLLTSSITKRGHEILLQTKLLIEESGFEVIYGDTDSVFVLLGDGYTTSTAKEIGRSLEQKLNLWWSKHIRDRYDLDSYLELEFETHYDRFLMPTARGSQSGTKKRYAGSISQVNGSSKLVFKGLETVRSDWTPLARRFQRELFERIFHDQPYETYIRDTVAQLFDGQLDSQLSYKKRIRQSLDQYQKNVPPHVQAARQLPSSGRWIEYLITLNGPQPKELWQSKPDYVHYQEKQLKPVADTLLQFLGQNFDDIVSGQQDFFP